VCICMSACMHVFVSVSTSECVHVSVCERVLMCKRECVRARARACVYVCLCLCVCVSLLGCDNSIHFHRFSAQSA